MEILRRSVNTRAVASIVHKKGRELPSMLVIGSVLEGKKTGACTALAILTATVAGFVFGLVA